jgi:hypothetical protein
MISKVIAVAALASVANAHIVITNPVPFPGIDNSPLFADGSNFPCKAVSYEAGGVSNSYAQGSTQTLEFQGTAVHGGGSCQVSVTQDLAPTRDSVWKVIKSIEGGCPAQGEAGNIGNDASSPVPYTYDFEIPADLAAGDYTLAWTWFNKVGNREMYMNCAPLTVTGSGGDDSFLAALPDMFTANIGNGCGTVSDTDLVFLNAGDSVDRYNQVGGTDAFAAPTGSCQAGNGGGNGGGSPSPTTPAPEPTTAPTTPPASPDPVPEPSTTTPGGIFVPVPTSSAPTEPAPTSLPTPPDNEDPVVGGMPPGTACFEEGTWNCVGGSSFQRCASGTWSAVQNLAAGVTCEDGQGTELRVNARSGERSMRRSLRVRV